MASFVARRAVGNLRHTRLTYAGCSRRAIHFTPAVQKKKAKVVIEDLFSDTIEEDLIKPEIADTKVSDVTPSSSASTSATPATVTATAQDSKRRKLEPEKRLARFNQIRDFIKPRLGRRPSVKLPQVKKSAWVQLVQLAMTEQQLTEVVEMMPGWIESGHKFDPQFSELFVRRCEELSCPLLALAVYGNYSKYNLPLTLPGARQLLHSLHTKHPIDKLITAVALYDVYNLEPISTDLVSCSMVVSACFKHNSKDSLKVADTFIPHLKQLLEKEKRLEISEDSKAVNLQKPNLWVKWTLKKVDKALFVKNGERADWLSTWRAANGHILEPSKF